MAGKEAIVGTDLDRDAERRGPALDLRAHPPLRRLRHHDQPRVVPRDRPRNLARESAGVIRIVEEDVIDLHAMPAQSLGEVPLGGQHQRDLLLVVRDNGAFLAHLHHQNDIALRIEPG